MCESRDLQKVVDLTELPFEVAYESVYYPYYAKFLNLDRDDYEFSDQYGGDNAETLEFEDIGQFVDYEYKSNLFLFPNQTQYWKLAMFLANSANASIPNAEFLNNNRLTQEDDMMAHLPLRICYDPSYEFEISNRRSSLLRDDILQGKNNCNQWHIFRLVEKLKHQFVNFLVHIITISTRLTLKNFNVQMKETMFIFASTDALNYNMNLIHFFLDR